MIKSNVSQRSSLPRPLELSMSEGKATLVGHKCGGCTCYSMITFPEGGSDGKYAAFCPICWCYAGKPTDEQKELAKTSPRITARQAVARA